MCIADPRRDRLARLGAGLRQRRLRLVDERHHRRTLRFKALPRRIARTRRMIERGIDRLGHRGRSIGQPLPSDCRHAFDAGQMRRELLRCAPGNLVGFAPACRKGGDLRVERARSFVRGETGGFELRGHLAALRMRLGQIGEQHRDVSARAGC